MILISHISLTKSLNQEIAGTLNTSNILLQKGFQPRDNVD